MTNFYLIMLFAKRGTAAQKLALAVMCAAMVMAVDFRVHRAHAESLMAADEGPSQSSDQHTVTGILSNLDLKSGKGVLKTDLGKPIFFDLTRPDLFQGISVGQRVSIVLNEQGQAMKVMETPPAEVLPPGAQ